MTTNSHDTELRQNVLIASCSRYENAERTVDFLSDYGFPAQKMSIVGRGLEGVEQPTGRLTSTAAAWHGAVSGAVAGAVVGWLFDWFGLMAPVISGLLLAGPLSSAGRRWPGRRVLRPRRGRRTGHGNSASRGGPAGHRCSGG
jgi:hypothetical protein